MEQYMPKWQYNDKIVQYLMKIHAAREVVLLLELPVNLEEKLKKESIIKTVHYSTKIEGNNLNIDEIYEVIENNRHSDKKEVQEVRNYYNALLFLDKKTENKVKITEDFIKQLHGIIEIRSIGRRTEKTPFRDGQNVIRDSISGGIVYLPPEYNDVPMLMKTLTDWIEDSDKIDIPTPIRAAIAAYQLVTIHPFWDGNGRTARALATYILKRGNYDLKGFYSMEEFYDKDIERYYNSLQMGLNHNYYFGRNNADLTIWITYFLEVMVDVFESVGKKISGLYKQDKPKNSIFDSLDKRQRWVAGYIIEKGFIKVKDVSLNFKIDERTARIWVKNWLDEGFIKKKDLIQQRNVNYVLGEKYLTEI